MLKTGIPASCFGDRDGSKMALISAAIIISSVFNLFSSATSIHVERNSQISFLFLFNRANPSSSPSIDVGNAGPAWAKAQQPAAAAKGRARTSVGYRSGWHASNGDFIWKVGMCYKYSRGHWHAIKAAPFNRLVI